MRIQLAIPDRHIDAGILDAALEATTRANEKVIASGEGPTAVEAIRRGVKWRAEPPGDEHFDLISTGAPRGWMDCDDWAPAHAASLRVTGEDPDARAVARRVAPYRWHAVVERSDGRIEDPSRWAGMGSKTGARGIAGGVIPLMTPPGSAAVGVIPYRGHWAARCDLPWLDTETSLAGIAYGAAPMDALQAALAGACYVGDASGVVHPDYIARAMALSGALCGGSARELQLAFLDQGINSDRMPREVLDHLVDTACSLPDGPALLRF